MKEIRSLSSIEKLQAMMISMPQWDAEKNTSHFFSEHMYCRVLFRPAGTLIVGKCHRKSHFYIVCSGTILVTDGIGEAKEYIGPCVIPSVPGTKRAVLALTDATCLTVHCTNETELDKIEAELIEEDETAMFDSHNHIKQTIKELT